MHYSYIVSLILIAVLTVVLDIQYSHTIARYPRQLLLTLCFLAGVFYFLVSAGVDLNLWSYRAEGLIGIRFLSLPVEEYGFMVIIPYSAIILWESLHRWAKRS